MSGELLVAGDDGPQRCVICGDEAVGPCARCKSPICGDCCVLTEGGAKPWAICVRCERRGGRSLTSGWWVVASWIALPIVLLAIAVAILGALAR